jgi:hypothetical protein
VNFLKSIFLIFVILFSSAFTNQKNCGELPPINKLIVTFVKANIGKKVGRGECWDLAAQALNQSGALWDGVYVFGKKLDLTKDCVFPGDIIQFENVQVQYTKQNAVYRETMDHHTAVVFSVDENKNMILAEQNTSDGGKRVRLSEFIPGNVRTGNVYVYRPVAP